MSEELTVGEQTRKLQDSDTPSWKDRLATILGHKKTVAAGAVAATLVATGTADNVLNSADNVADAVTRPIEAVLPGTSEDFKTPKNVLTGSIDVHIDGELKARKDPNTSGDIVDWKKLKLVTEEFDPNDNKMKEKLVDLSAAERFRVSNLLMVEAQATGGGFSEDRNWGKIRAEDEHGERFDLYFSVSEETNAEIDRKDNDIIPIDFKDLGDGKSAVKPKDASSNAPTIGTVNSITLIQPQD
ncbi:MAG: hypothetical protein Q7T54_00945 [Candidatus Levybacteria bacterium]|nr:hypothetical protein [Candidatus Levybacteria bacterium]